MIVVCDASALVEYLNASKEGTVVRKLIRESRAEIHVPEICDLEVCSSLFRLIRKRQLNAEEAEQRIATYRRMRLSRYPHEPFLSRVFALRDVATAYDASYIALAESLGTQLVTGDKGVALAADKLVNVIRIWS